jgi:hypothetical protein
LSKLDRQNSVDKGLEFIFRGSAGQDSPECDPQGNGRTYRSSLNSSTTACMPIPSGHDFSRRPPVEPQDQATGKEHLTCRSEQDSLISTGRGKLDKADCTSGHTTLWCRASWN